MRLQFLVVQRDFISRCDQVFYEIIKLLTWLFLILSTPICAALFLTFRLTLMSCFIKQDLLIHVYAETLTLKSAGHSNQFKSWLLHICLDITMAKGFASSSAWWTWIIDHERAAGYWELSNIEREWRAEGIEIHRRMIFRTGKKKNNKIE
jgi:hypothetical protein